MKKQISHLLKDILTSGLKSDDYTILYKLILINSFLIFGGIAFTIISIEWLIYKKLSFLIISLVACTSFWFFIYLFRKIEKIDNIVLIASLIPFFCTLAFLILNKNDDIGILWAYISVMFIIFLNGYKKGGIIVFIFYALLITDMYVDYEQWVKFGWSVVSTIRFIITSILAICLACMSDYVFSNLQKKTRILSETDFLTGIRNRRSLNEMIKVELHRHKRHCLTLCLCILDIDNFKRVNDTMGHSFGDSVLKSISELITNEIRITDKFGRWGGEEFCILFPETKLKDANDILERIRLKINNTKIDTTNNITCSFGMVETNEENLNFDMLVTIADKELYRAKKLGKNKVCSHSLID